MKISEIREMSVVDLQERIEAEKASLNSFKIEHTVSPVENTTTLNKARKDIAKMLTILNEKNKR
ncbi:MAG: 50S ribosomal protein L29 [Bacteroidetes bacterium]|nr:50S ribosomal protein L29 [Bacteroidota bacterium]